MFVMHTHTHTHIIYIYQHLSLRVCANSLLHSTICNTMQYTKYTVHFYSGAMKACVALDFTTHFFCVEQFFQSCTKWHNAQDPEDGLLRERDLASKGQERRV